MKLDEINTEKVAKLKKMMFLKSRKEYLMIISILNCAVQWNMKD